MFVVSILLDCLLNFISFIRYQSQPSDQTYGSIYFLIFNEVSNGQSLRNTGSSWAPFGQSGLAKSGQAGFSITFHVFSIFFWANPPSTKGKLFQAGSGRASITKLKPCPFINQANLRPKPNLERARLGFGLAQPINTPTYDKIKHWLVYIHDN